MKRRDFLKYASVVGGVSVMPQILSADDSSNFSDFKAIVLVDLQGGNDALNTFIPTSSDAKSGYDNYVKQRGSVISIPNNDMMSDLQALVNNSGKLEITAPKQNPYYENLDESKSYMKGFYLLDKDFENKIAVNAMMPEIAYWMDRQRGAVIQNIGNIIGPYTKSELKNNKRKLTPGLFAHNLQNRLAHIGMASSLNVSTGWLGKLADKWGNVNGDNIYKMNINLSGYGIERAMFGETTNPMNYSYNGPTKLSRNIERGFEEWTTKRKSEDIFQDLYANIRSSSYNESVATIQDWEDIKKNNPFEDVTDVYGNHIYKGEEVSKAQMGLGNSINMRDIESFKTAARLIAIAKKKGFKRITLSIVMGGFDQHSNLMGNHSLRLRALSMGADAFMRGMESLGALDEVALISLSDFSRSTAGNSNGSDHAWGGSQFALGAVNAGNYGEFPDLTAGGEMDISSRGRIIPTTSYSQYYSTVLKWFGANNNEINHALPELKNFSTKDLGFMKIS